MKTQAERIQELMQQSAMQFHAKAGTNKTEAEIKKEVTDHLETLKEDCKYDRF